MVVLFSPLLYTVIFIYHGVSALEVEIITMLLLGRGRRSSSLLAAPVSRSKHQQRIALLRLEKLSVLLGGSCRPRQVRFFLVKELMRESVRLLGINGYWRLLLWRALLPFRNDLGFYVPYEVGQFLYLLLFGLQAPHNLIPSLQGLLGEH